MRHIRAGRVCVIGPSLIPGLRYIGRVMSQELDRLVRLAEDSRHQARHAADPAARQRWEVIAAVYDRLSGRSEEAGSDPSR